MKSICLARPFSRRASIRQLLEAADLAQRAGDREGGERLINEIFAALDELIIDKDSKPRFIDFG